MEIKDNKCQGCNSFTGTGCSEGFVNYCGDEKITDICDGCKYFDNKSCVIGFCICADNQKMKNEIRVFETGATRDTDVGKIDYEGFLSPIVLERYAIYLHKHRKQSDGKIRDSDNWQKGIPKDVYIKSAWRHFMDWWKEHRGIHTSEYGIEDALMALLFNVMGYANEYFKEETKND